MTYKITRFLMRSLVILVLTTLLSAGVSGAVLYPDPASATIGVPSDPVRTQTIHTITRLTRNKVTDATPMISDSIIYWERFGGEQGDTEIFSFHVNNGTTNTRVTNNRREDTLQAPGVWISSPVTRSLRNFHGVIDFSSFSDPKLGRINNRNARRTEIVSDNGRITRNRRQERSVQLAGNVMDGMVWLSRKIPHPGVAGIIQAEQGYDVFWYNRVNSETTRLNGTAKANSVAFNGPWAVWTSPGSDNINTAVQDKLTLYNVHTGETRNIDAEGPVGIQAADQYVMYSTTAGNVNPDPDLSNIIIYSGIEERVMLYDTVSDTTTEVGADAALGFHRDLDAVLSNHYVAYDRSFQNPFTIAITNVYPPKPPPPDITELRLYNINTMSDILVTEGEYIAGLQIDNHTLVWEMLDKSDPLEKNWDMEIYAYDILKEEVRQVTDNLVDDRRPQIEGDTIVWTTYLENGGSEIYYETTSVFTVTNPIDVVLPDLQARRPVLASVSVVPEPASAGLLSLAGVLMLTQNRTCIRLRLRDM